MSPPAVLRTAALFFVVLNSEVGLASRQSVQLHNQQLHSSALLSDKRTQARFIAAFPELHAEAQVSCPYGNVNTSTAGGEKSFECHIHSKDFGATCPQVQAMRFNRARQFQAASHSEFAAAAAKIDELDILFDKSKKLVGDEDFETLVHYQIEGLKREDVGRIEDKINLKTLSKELGVPMTEAYFAAHVSDFKAEAFTATMKKLCGRGVDAFIIKATHLAWSHGQKIVRGWQQDCKDEDKATAKINDLISFINKEILSVKAAESDGHLNFLEPGVIMEELFRTGGKSVRPLEAKVYVLWGKMHSAIFFGDDSRGCTIHPFAWVAYADKTGWNINFPDAQKDPIADRYFKQAHEEMVTQAEKFARGVKADFMRVDFFVKIPDDENEAMTVHLNECESVSGDPFLYNRQGVAEIWRDGYILSGKVNPPFGQIARSTFDARNALNLDPEPH